jgi:geranylgeranyl pyrophosphate synthase
MFRGALRAACALTGAAEEERKALSRYASNFGMMFQAVDDLLDVEGEERALGKTRARTITSASSPAWASTAAAAPGR